MSRTDYHFWANSFNDILSTIIFKVEVIDWYWLVRSDFDCFQSFEVLHS